MFEVNDYVWFGDEICQVTALWGIDEYGICSCLYDGSLGSIFYVQEHEIRHASDDEYTVYMGEDEDE